MLVCSLPDAGVVGGAEGLSLPTCTMELRSLWSSLRFALQTNVRYFLGFLRGQEAHVTRPCRVCEESSSEDLRGTGAHVFRCFNEKEVAVRNSFM